MNIFESIASIMAEIPAIGKGKKNQQQGFMYRGVDDVMNALQPLLAKYKVFVVPDVLSQTREERTTKNGSNMLYSLLHVRFTFFAEDGSNVVASVIGEGMDTADKASNKAIAVAFKYACFQVFCIPTEEMQDPDGDTHEPSRPTTPAIPQGENPPITTCFCETCKKQIQPVKKKDGSIWNVRDMVTFSKLKYGKQLCSACMKKEQEAHGKPAVS